MKRLLSVLLLCAAFPTSAQVKIGRNPTAIQPRVALEIDDTTRGLLIPRMTLAQRSAMGLVPLGMMVYITDPTARLVHQQQQRFYQ